MATSNIWNLQCDRTLPLCFNCTKAGRQCGGYDPDAIRAFVNLDATNVSHPNKKRLVDEARIKANDSRSNDCRLLYRDQSANQIPGPSSSRAIPLSRLDIITLETDFRQHFEVLWRTFILSYCQTKDYWPIGCSALSLRNKALDFSLVALSAQRLALNSPGSSLHVLSLTAYNKSIGLYRSLMQHKQSKELNGILAVTSTVYALVDACLKQPTDIAMFSWGTSGHFDGALALMMKTGPEIYSASGFHQVFKKIREMGVR